MVLPVVHRPRPNSEATSRPTPRAPRYGMPASRSSVSGKPRGLFLGLSSGRLTLETAAPEPPVAAGSTFAPRDVGWTVPLAVAALGPSWRAPGPFPGPPLTGA